MAGKFINTTHKDNINKMVFGLQDIIKNPYYKWLNSTPTLTEYYNQNTSASTLGEGALLQYADRGDDSPTWYNLIKDFYLYGLERIQIQLENEEFGLSSSNIEGEAIILPNTITPYVGDYFEICYIKEEVLFRVTDVSFDTLENGANFYKIQYKLESTQPGNLKENIKDKYHMIIDNIGTNFNTIIRDEKYDLIEKLDAALIGLKKYYKSLFYSNRVQTFIFKFNEEYFYDPYMIEFITKNGLMDGDDEYIYLYHVLPLPATFALDYSRTIFNLLEQGNVKNIRRYRHDAIGEYITSNTCIFFNRPENYFKINFNYNTVEQNSIGCIPCFSEDFINHAEKFILFDLDDINMIYNPILKFLNNDEMILTEEELECLEFLDYHNNVTLFYALPCVIFCIERYIKRLLVEHKQ